MRGKTGAREIEFNDGTRMNKLEKNLHLKKSGVFLALSLVDKNVALHFHEYKAMLHFCC